MNIDWSKTNDEILSFLNESILVPNGKRLRFNDIELQFPNTGYMELVATSVASAAKVDILAQLVFNSGSSVGADLSTLKAQKKIMAIANAANWPTDLTSWILSYCAFNGPRWKHLGLPEPSLEWIQKERDKIQEDLNKVERDKQYAELIEKWISCYSKGLSWINFQKTNNRPLPTFDELLTAIRE